MSPKNCTILVLQVYYGNFWQAYTSVNFLSEAYFTFFIRSKAENQLKFLMRSMLAKHVRTSLKLLSLEMPDFIIAPNIWLLNIPDFSPVDYRILAVLQE